MKAKFLFVSLFLNLLNCYSQFDSDTLSPIKKSKITYFQVDFSVPLKANPYRDDENDYSENQRDTWFIPDGMSVRAGFGVHYKKWIALGLHSGIDWKISDKLVVAPVFGNLKFCPRLTEDDEMRLFVSFGYGKSFALGRGNLTGKFISGRLGIESLDDDPKSFLIFIEISKYDLLFHNYTNGTGSFSLGIARIF